jgi:hypothetical protein
MAGKNKEVLINIRLKPETREEFRISAELRGATMSGLLHQFIVRTIREEKERDPEAFASLQGVTQTEERHPADKALDPQLFARQNEIYKRFLNEKEGSPDSGDTPHPKIIEKGNTEKPQRGSMRGKKDDKY